MRSKERSTSSKPGPLQAFQGLVANTPGVSWALADIVVRTIAVPRRRAADQTSRMRSVAVVTARNSPATHEDRRFTSLGVPAYLLLLRRGLARTAITRANLTHLVPATGCAAA
jgi:hypothetical protein